MKSRKLLQGNKFIHGSFMRSLVRNIYDNYFYKSIIHFKNINNYLIIGYFKLSQAINEAKYLPLITLGDFKNYYHFLNLYIT